MSVLIYYNCEIKAESKKDYDIIKSYFENKTFENLDSLPNYVETILDECEFEDDKFKITYTDEDYAHPQTELIFLELLKNIVRKNDSLSFTAQDTISCTDGENTEDTSFYICKNGKLLLRKFAPFKLFDEMKYSQGTSVIIYLEGYLPELLFNAEIEAIEPIVSVLSGSYQPGNYFFAKNKIVSEKELINIFKDFCEDCFETWSNDIPEMYIRYNEGGMIKEFYFTYNDGKITKEDITNKTLEYPIESEINLSAQTIIGGNNYDDYDEDYDEDDWGDDD